MVQSWRAEIHLRNLKKSTGFKVLAAVTLNSSSIGIISLLGSGVASATPAIPPTMSSWYVEDVNTSTAYNTGCAHTQFANSVGMRGTVILDFGGQVNSSTLEEINGLQVSDSQVQSMVVAGAEARSLGWGGVSLVARASGLSIPTVRKAVHELTSAEQAEQLPPGRSRQPGGGRKRAVVLEPGLTDAVSSLVDPDSRGDPESPLRWTIKSTRVLAGALGEMGYHVSHVRVAEILHALHFSLQGNRKTLEGKQHPDRDAQFRYINELAKARLVANLPVVSVDTKKKELIGASPGYANGGKEWQPKDTPEKVGVHDFPDPKIGKAVPYGVYDIGTNTGWVLVGADHDTAAFAVAALRRWWQSMGQPLYPDAHQLLICADAGGSNSYRNRLWKVELAAFASETGLSITVCHLPPGTSKWNKIEHRLFSAITLNWRGRPLVSHEAVVELIAATTNTKGLSVRAAVDRGSYPKGIKITNAQLLAAGVRNHSFHGEWNYDIGTQTEMTMSQSSE